MKLALGAAISALAFATVALAQTTETVPAAPTPPPAPAIVTPPSACGDLPAKPTVPDGAVAKEKDMKAADAAVQAWQASVQTNLKCRKAEFEAADAIRVARFNDYNNVVRELNSFGAVWTTEAQKYNARTGAAAPKEGRTGRNAK
jgi:hypothetical protein